MKIGIITFQDADNYGAVLQAYSLKTFINKFEDCKIINYYNAYFHEEKEKSLKQTIKKMIFLKAFQKKKDGFKKFRREYLTNGAPWITKDDLHELNNIYDLFIVGSDQVWNLSCSGESDVYFLSFVEDESKKTSFAASFGSSTPFLDNKHIDYIRNFSLISVREKSGVDYLNGNGISAIQLMDPVFLLSKEKWEALAERTENKYILVYEVVNGKEMLKFAKNLSTKTGLAVHFITASNRPQLQMGVKIIRDADPLEWLREIRNAEYVITNSFHGLAFSIIFNRPFYIEFLQNSNTNARMIELLGIFGIKNRMITDVKNVEIDFSEINRLIDEERKKSINYIKALIGEKR